MRLHLLLSVRARLLRHPPAAQAQGDRRVRARLRGRLHRLREHLAVHVHAGHVLRRRPPAAHEHRGERADHAHAAQLLLEVAQLVAAARPVEHDLLVRQPVAVRLLAVRARLCRVDRPARLQEGHQVARHRDQPHTLPHRLLHDRHLVRHVGRLRLRQRQVTVGSQYVYLYIYIIAF